MFGRGIYFADIVSEAAQYCDASDNDNVGLVMLCDVVEILLTFDEFYS